MQKKAEEDPHKPNMAMEFQEDQDLLDLVEKKDLQGQLEKLVHQEFQERKD